MQRVAIPIFTIDHASAILFALIVSLFCYSAFWCQGSSRMAAIKGNSLSGQGKGERVQQVLFKQINQTSCCGWSAGAPLTPPSPGQQGWDSLFGEMQLADSDLQESSRGVFREL